MKNTRERKGSGWVKKADGTFWVSIDPKCRKELAQLEWSRASANSLYIETLAQLQETQVKLQEAERRLSNTIGKRLCKLVDRLRRRK